MTLHPSKLAPSTLRQYGMGAAECVFDPELHTGPIDGAETSEQKAARVDVAAEVCLSCPVMTRCLDRAISGRPEPGVWGGLDAEPLTAVFAGHAGTDLEEVA
ncbi:WhiB family transcriptional regulator [Spirillospora sp. CA-255316]